MFRKWWWKILGIILFTLNVIVGITIKVPVKPIVNETIRNYFFHPPLWVVMMVMFTTSLVYSIRYLRSNNRIHDIKAITFASTGILYGLSGLATGMFWAKYTWGAFWSGDPKLMGTCVGLLIYLAYFILRNSIDDIDKRAKVGSVYNIFAYAMLFPTIFIIPRMVDSLHPGSTGNPMINPVDVSKNMFYIFWSISVPGWLLVGFWVNNLNMRLKLIEETIAEKSIG